MKRVTASEARRNWFRLLDEVIEGETVVLERKGWRILLRREKRTDKGSVPVYTDLLRDGDVDDADRWGWEWSPDSGLEPHETG